MWVGSERNSLCTSPNEEAGPLANNALLTKKQGIKIAKYHKIMNMAIAYNVPGPRSGKDCKIKKGLERHNPDGSSQPGQTAARARTMREKILSFKASGKEISAEIDAL